VPLDFSFSDGNAFRVDSDPFVESYADNDLFKYFVARTSAGDVEFGLLNDAPVHVIDTGAEYAGDVFFTGNVQAPHFDTGIFALENGYTSAPVTLTITAAAPGAPGPEMGAGLLSALAAGLALLVTRVKRRGFALARLSP
jgi:hypothetical protein